MNTKPEAVRFDATAVKLSENCNIVNKVNMTVCRFQSVRMNIFIIRCNVM